MRAGLFSISAVCSETFDLPSLQANFRDLCVSKTGFIRRSHGEVDNEIAIEVWYSVWCPSAAVFSAFIFFSIRVPSATGPRKHL